MALNKRERWMVTCALLVVAYALINMALLSPVLAHQKTLTNEIETDQSQIQELNLQITEFGKQNIVDPDAKNKQRIAEIESHLQLLETKLSSLQSTLIAPDKMPELLRTLLKKNGALKLIELKTLPASSLIDNSSKDKESDIKKSTLTEQVTSHIEKPSNQDSPVFKHGVEITIEGRYLDLLAYVANLEKMPWHVLWSKADLNTKNYPYSQLKLTVYTLSLDQTWLSI